MEEIFGTPSEGPTPPVMPEQVPVEGPGVEDAELDEEQPESTPPLVPSQEESLEPPPLVNEGGEVEAASYGPSPRTRRSRKPGGEYFAGPKLETGTSTGSRSLLKQEVRDFHLGRDTWGSGVGPPLGPP